MFKATSLLIVSVLLSACASAPIQEMSDARQAINAASKAGAAVRSPAILNRAKHHLVVAESALDRGEYSRAKKSALKAKQQAVKARLISVNSP